MVGSRSGSLVAWLSRYAPLIVAGAALIMLVGAVVDGAWIWSAVSVVLLVAGPLQLIQTRRRDERSAAAAGQWSSQRVASAVQMAGPGLVPRVVALRKQDQALSLLDATRLVRQLPDTV